MENVLTAADLTFGYADRPLINGVGLDIARGEIVSIVGPNGSGKSTVLRLLTRLLNPSGGAVFLEGEAIARLNTKKIARKLTMLPQTQDHLLEMTVRDLVRQGRNPHLKWYEECRGEHEDVVDWALSMTDLTALQYRQLYTMSGGERQRAWIAMAIAQKPHTLLLDEPTTYLDIAHQLEIMELLRHLNKTQGITIAMVLHDLNQASRYSDRIIAIKDGQIVRQGEPKAVFDQAFFRDVFSIEAKIRMDGGKPEFTPYGVVRTRTEEAAEAI
ncbi:ABC transporter ATP-binding protein [Cohnella soli]|uniref:ABC transporter ATP-binding protein n=1 Tax=Cohnella soli TaxID=425005 RepID=A0ABW0HLC5_9BACL